MQTELAVSERRVCRVLGQHRSTQRKVPRGADDEDALTEDIVALARQYGRYGYRRITALLRDAGWTVNRKRVERIWRREGLKVPQKQPKRGRLWLNDGSCIRLRPEYPGHGTVRISVCGRAVEHYAAMALMKRSPKMTANWALAMDHSRGGIFHSFSDRFKIR